MIEEAFAFSQGARLLEKLGRAGVPAGRVRTLEEVYDWEQVESQRLKVTVNPPALGR